MSIFNPFVSSCEHERNLDWILKRVKDMPRKEEMESALEEARAIDKRAYGLVKQVELVIDDATKAAKEEIKKDLDGSIGRIEDAERNTLAKAAEVKTAIDNATYNAKLEISNYVNAQLTEIRALAESVSEDAGYVEQVVTDAASAIKNQITNDIDSRYSELSTQLSSKIAGDIETAKNTLSSVNSASLNAHKSALSAHVGTELSTAKNNLVIEVNSRYSAKVVELEGHVNDYVPHAVASSLNERFATCGVFIPVDAWNGKTARVSASINVDVTSLFVTYSPGSFNDWYDNCVRCTGADGAFLTFECATVPTRELYVYVLAVESIVYEE